MMKQNKLITLIVLTITVICSSLPLQGQTKLYNQYKHRTDMVVMCVMDYPLTDSVKVDVTLFIPKTKEAVYTLVEEFNLGIEKDIIDKDLGDEYSGLLTRIVCSDNVKKKYGNTSSDDYTNISKLVYNCSKGVILVFHNIETEQRSDILEQFLIGTLKRPELLSQINEDK